ncbi:MAG: phage tail protein [Pusillimonas sp.]
MAVQLPNGVVFSLGTTIDAAKTVSSISNANPAVATSTAHGFANGDIILLNSGWQKLNDRLLRVANQASGTFELAGQDTTSTTLYPTGTSAGSAKKVSAWTQITQVLECSTSGGEMQFATYSFLENDFESQIPTQHSAMSLQLSIADDPSLTGYAALKKAAADRVAVPVRAQMPGGSVIYYMGYVSFNETPTMTKNNVMACNATVSLQSLPVRYAT